ncbi:MAG: D-glycero-beta-D-manno-heptose 1-phosphate adenylyltransferase [Thermodesulfobacteriota bacterium]
MRIAEILKRFGRQKVLVVGDIMLDRHVRGTVERISPEAPVPVLRVTEEACAPGGAGNVAVNLRTLGAKVELAGSLGKDREGDEIVHFLREHDIGTGGIVRDRAKPTTSKTRLIAGNQQIARMDKEVDAHPHGSVDKALMKSIERAVREFKPRGIIISDYSKGVLTDTLVSRVIELAKKSRIFVTVDPKGKNYQKYRGADAITPNLREAETASGIKITDELTLGKAAEIIMKQTEAGFVLITRGADGISYFSRHGESGTVPSHPVEVFDVTGAGDTAASVFTLSYIASSLLGESVKIANAAAGIVVSRIGTASVTKADLEAYFAREEQKEKGKIRTRGALAKTLAGLRAKGRKVVFTNGCFDLFHTGHLRLLREARKLGDALVVAINSDRSVRKLKGPGRPYIGEEDRALLLAALDCVDYICVFGEDTPLELIKELKPDVLVKGGDYRREDIIGGDFVESLGGRVAIIPLIEGMSTSSLAEKIKNNK